MGHNPALKPRYDLKKAQVDPALQQEIQGLPAAKARHKVEQRLKDDGFLKNNSMYKLSVAPSMYLKQNDGIITYLNVKKN